MEWKKWKEELIPGYDDDGTKRWNIRTAQKKEEKKTRSKRRKPHEAWIWILYFALLLLPSFTNLDATSTSSSTISSPLFVFYFSTHSFSCAKKQRQKMFKYLFFSLEEKPFLYYIFFVPSLLAVLCVNGLAVVGLLQGKNTVWLKKETNKKKLYVYLFDVCLTEMKGKKIFNLPTKTSILELFV